uniref:LRRCT domain-containing protein n=1 Tax=Echeneis naucrates TaxID=173247 RepID=A0A665TV50_ECHNA
MDKESGLTLFLVLLLCHKGNTLSQTSCPYKCQCFTPVQVLCADERMISLPTNISKQVKDFIVMTSGLAYLFPNTLEESPQLTKLVFLNNALRSIHSQAFKHLTELQELEISGNPTLDKFFPETFSNQRNLMKLVLNFNRFREILPGMFDSLKQLQTLQMKGNFLLELPKFLFLNLHNLKFLDLSQNKLEDVRRETFSGLARLEILKMNNNLIDNITSDTFKNISQLTELHLEGNMISELSEGTFSTLSNLKVLNLRGNLLRAFTLSVLILSSNQLSTLPEDIFRNLTVLETVDLSENQLTFLPETIFKGLSSVEVIHLHMNNLSKVEPKLFEDQIFIQQLYLSDNQLKTIPFGLLDTFDIQPTLRLHGNPWSCDCHMWYLHDWVLRNTLDIEMVERMLCESPGYLRRRTVISIEKDQLLCQVFQDEMPGLNSCSLQTSSDTIVIKCKVDKCSPLAVMVEFQEVDGNINEHILKKDISQCSNETMTNNSNQ